MVIHKKLTRSNHLSWGYLCHIGVVNMPLTSTIIPLLLIVLLRIRTILGPMTCPATIPAWPVCWRNKRIPWSGGALWKGYSKCFLETGLCLILLLWRPVPNGCSRWAKLSLRYWSFSLRDTCLKGPLAIFGSSIDIIVILLSKSIAYELIESDTRCFPWTSSVWD